MLYPLGTSDLELHPCTVMHVPMQQVAYGRLLFFASAPRATQCSRPWPSSRTKLAAHRSPCFSWLFPYSSVHCPAVHGRTPSSLESPARRKTTATLWPGDTAWSFPSTSHLLPHALAAMADPTSICSHAGYHVKGHLAYKSTCQ